MFAAELCQGLAPRTHTHTHTHTHTIMKAEKIPSKSTCAPPAAEWPSPGQPPKAAPPASEQPLPWGPDVSAPGPTVAGASLGWGHGAGLHGDRCSDLPAKTRISLSGGPGPLVLTLACKWTAQPGTECVCVGGACVWVASCSIRPQTLHPDQEAEKGGVVQWGLLWPKPDHPDSTRDSPMPPFPHL